MTMRGALGRIGPNKGFTIIELTSVMVILAILSISAYPVITGSGGPGLSESAEVVKSDIRRTQLAAMTAGSVRSIAFTAGSAGYAYEIPAGGTGISRDSGSIAHGLTIGNGLTISFNSLGEPATGGQVSVALQGVSKTIAVAPFTGMVTIQ
ncbi:MAG: prepilin-type N-terminal cleavage/methylation domain-containing protein [Nitrospinae bacterium]|nr:prepilin-type N-terminal cleavage/methylation domain-containing protein [Nitrospinota bacterium]